MKDKKIRELATKCKTINLALERERTMYSPPHLVAAISNSNSTPLSRPTRKLRSRRKAATLWKRPRQAEPRVNARGVRSKKRR